MPLEREGKKIIAINKTNFRECKLWTYGWKSPPPLFFQRQLRAKNISIFSQLAKDATKVDELPKLSSLKSETF